VVRRVVEGADELSPNTEVLQTVRRRTMLEDHVGVLQSHRHRCNGTLPKGSLQQQGLLLPPHGAALVRSEITNNIRTCATCRTLRGGETPLGQRESVWGSGKRKQRWRGRGQTKAVLGVLVVKMVLSRAPMSSSDLIVPSKLPSFRSPGDHVLNFADGPPRLTEAVDGATDRVAAENTAPIVYLGCDVRWDTKW
jgi:hypothetical protein